MTGPETGRFIIGTRCGSTDRPPPAREAIPAGGPNAGGSKKPVLDEVQAGRTATPELRFAAAARPALAGTGRIERAYERIVGTRGAIRRRAGDRSRRWNRGP